MRGCEVCGGEIIGRSDKTCCSVECKRVRKSRYDRTLYGEIREDRIAQVRAWYQENRESKKAYDARYRERDRESRLAAKREYGRTHPGDPLARRLSTARRRARRIGNGEYVVAARDLVRLLDRYHHSCATCGTPFGIGPRALEWDHVVPIARGGRHAIGNLWPLCRNCNRNKSIRLVTEWRVGRVVSKRAIAA